MDEQNSQLIPFLRELANTIESGELSQKELQRVGEFYMSYQFHKQAILDNEEDEVDNRFDTTQIDLVKFVTLGWYVYNHLLSGLSLSTEDEEDEENELERR